LYKNYSRISINNAYLPQFSDFFEGPKNDFVMRKQPLRRAEKEQKDYTINPTTALGRFASIPFLGCDTYTIG